MRLSPHRAHHLRSCSRAKHPAAILRISPAYPEYTGHSLRVRWVPVCRSCRRLGAFAMGTLPRVPGFPVCRLLCPIRLSSQASSLRETLPPHYFPTALCIHRGVSRVHHGGLKPDGAGGMCLVAPSTHCGSPVPGKGRQVRLSHLLPNRSCMLHRSCDRQGGFELDGLA